MEKVLKTYKTKMSEPNTVQNKNQITMILKLPVICTAEIAQLGER